MGGDESGSASSHPLAALSVRTRAILIWGGVAVLLVVAFAAALGALQRGVYSAGGFVSAYVTSLADRDVDAALQMPGADPTTASLTDDGLPAKPSRELLRADVLPTIRQVRVLSDDELVSGEHLVTLGARVDGHPVTVRFQVRQTGAVLGILPTWRFSATPLTVAHITVEHADTFTVAGHTLDPRAVAAQPVNAFTVTADYLVFAPGVYDLGHESKYLSAPTSTLTAAAPGRLVNVAVVAEPTRALVAQIGEQLHSYLDACAKQQVLQPAGCPFGVTIDDRVEGLPSWSIAKYPPVTLAAGDDGWTMPETAGAAHLSVTVQSLFDGSIDRRSSDEPFTVSLSAISIRDDGAVDITVSG
ncbi:hypothetical protein [Leifsonia poae]|uniref:hypothetical protein n=1 Tax=Leifsonia poae TaxID=110933 RepID=UPI001CC1A289|nr:hypothetical protein [Leifsonia poae]